jgi:hypothetical protein
MYASILSLAYVLPQVVERLYEDQVHLSSLEGQMNVS